MALPAAAHAQFGGANGFDYFASNGQIAITGYYGPGGAVIIPSMIAGVTGTVTTIESFSSDIHVTSVTIPSSVTSIGVFAFSECTGLTSVTIPSGVNSIGESAFSECTGLTSVTISTGVASIEDFAFEDCTGLTSVTIPTSVTSIGYGAFEGCTELTSIAVNSGNPDYSSAGGILFNNSKTTLVEYPGGLAGSYTIPATVTSIGDNAFEGCTKLTSVTIPTGVTSIGEAVFYACAGLTSINVNSGNPDYSSPGGILFNYSGTTLVEYPGGRAGSYTIPATVTSIGDWAFGGNTGLTSVTIPSSVTSIGDWALWTTGLTSVTIPSSVTSIGDNAFVDCIYLASVYFMGNVPTTGSNVFAADNAPGFTVAYYNGAAGFTSPTWTDSSGDTYPAANMGTPPLSSWLFFNGLASNANLQSTPNNDGVPLLMDYALNLNPTQNQSGSMPQPVISGNQLCLTFYIGAPGVTYTVQASTDLQTWSTSGVTTSVPDASNFCTATVPVTGTSTFMRLVVTY